jgi:ABC-type sugar transport system substrate-binding protein
MRTTLKSLMATSLVAAALTGSGMTQAQDLTIATSVPSLGFPFFVHMLNQIKAEAAARK